MTKFQPLSISHRRGQKVADDHGQLTGVVLPPGGFEVNEDGWLRACDDDELVAAGKAGARPSVFLDVAVDGNSVGTLVVDVYADLAPRCARALVMACADAGRGRGGYLDAAAAFGGDVAALRIGWRSRERDETVAPTGDAAIGSRSRHPSSVSSSPPRSSFARLGLSVETRSGEAMTHAAGEGTVSLHTATGELAVLFAPAPRWDAGERQVVGRIRRGCEDVMEAMRRAASSVGCDALQGGCSVISLRLRRVNLLVAGCVHDPA